MNQQPPRLADLPAAVLFHLVGAPAMVRGYISTIFKINDNNRTFSVIYDAKTDAGYIMWERNIPLEKLRLEQSWKDSLRYRLAESLPEEHVSVVKSMVADRVTDLDNKLRGCREVRTAIPWKVRQVKRADGAGRPTFKVELKKTGKNQSYYVPMHIALEKISPDGELLEYEE